MAKLVYDNGWKLRTGMPQQLAATLRMAEELLTSVSNLPLASAVDESDFVAVCAARDAYEAHKQTCAELYNCLFADRDCSAAAVMYKRLEAARALLLNMSDELQDAFNEHVRAATTADYNKLMGY